MYSLDCNYYHKTFESIHDLVQDVIRSGQDPSYQITEDGVPIGEEVTDFIIM